MIDDANSKRYLCKYQVKNFILMMDDEKIETDPTNILSIEYLTDYEFNLRSVIKVTIRVDIRKKLWILKNKRKIVCKFELNKIGMDLDTEMFITNPEPVWNQNFSIFLNDEDEATDIHALEERIARTEGSFNLNDIEIENYFESQNVIPLFLFNQKMLNASNKIYNEVYTANTVQQFIGRLLTETKHSNVLMSKCENNEVYKELLIPPLPAYKAITYLDQYYGLYKKGALIFYDADTLYILNSDCSKVTAKRKDEWTDTTFIVTGLNTTRPGNGMIRKEGEKINYICLSDMDINTQKFTIVNNENMGSEAKVVISDDITVNIEDADQSYIDQRNQNITFSRKSDNKFNANIIKARMEENELIFYINGENFDITSFTPNKIFNIVFEEPLKQKKFGMYKYKIVYAYHFLLVESEGYMSSSHRICLKKCSS